jgi:glycosyltransferase involved in cell wall biosynthesis
MSAHKSTRMPTPSANGARKKIGVYLQQQFDDVGGAEFEALVLAIDLAREHQVELLHHKTIDVAAVCSEKFGLDLRQVGFRTVESPPSWPQYLSIAAPPRGALRDWLQDLSGRYDLFVSFSHDVPPYCYAKAGVLRILFPFIDKAAIWPWNPNTVNGDGRVRSALRRWYYDRHWNDRLGRYQVKAANSAYTRDWTRRYWGVDADVIYPPVDRRFAVRDKEPIILSVGRICPMKKQLELVQAFARLTDLHAAGWRFCVAGGATPTPECQRYVAAVREAAEGLPVDFVINPDNDAVMDLFERAAVFWHAAGLGIDPDLMPGKMEHFGIATAEAMQAGCVPVVINRGGQTELVRPGVDGLLWNDADELLAVTRSAANDSARSAAMAASARQRAQAYTREAFVDGFRRRLQRVL